MPKQKKPPPSPEKVQQQEQDEAAADEIVASMWDSSSRYAELVQEQYSSVLQELTHWFNDGNGSCQLHTTAHGVGYMAKADSTVPPEQAVFMRDALSSAALCYISQGRWRNIPAFHRAPKDDRQLLGLDLQIAIRRARLLEVSVPNNVPGTRSNDNSTWMDRLVERLRDQYEKPREQLPSTALLLVAELENVNIVVLRRNDDAQLEQARYGDRPLAFTPHAGTAQRTILVQHCLYGQETAAASYYTHVHVDKHGKATGQLSRRRMSENHYVYLQHESVAEPQMQALPGTAAWKERMSVGMDRIEVKARAGTPSELRQPQPPLRPSTATGPPQQQQQQQQEDRSSQQENQQQQQQQNQRQQQQLPHGQQKKNQQQNRTAGNTKKTKTKTTQPERYSFECCMCHKSISLAPERPGSTLAQHQRKEHPNTAVPQLINQIKALCEQPTAAPQPLTKWASEARCCVECHGLMTGDSATCIKCRRSGTAQNKTARSAAGKTTSLRDAKGSTDSATTSTDDSSDTSSNSSSGSDSDVDDSDEHDSTPISNRPATIPQVPAPQRWNPYSKEPRTVPPTGRNTDTTSNGKARGSSNNKQTQPSVVDEPTWSHNDAAIAPVLDSISEEQMVLLRNITSARASRTSRQRRQFRAVMTHVVKLLKEALDAMRESIEASKAGAGATQQTQADLSLRRAIKLWWFIPFLAYGRQMEGKGVRPKERMDALYSGTFAAALQKHLDAHRTAMQKQSQTTAQPFHVNASTTTTAKQCPVSDADKGWSESDRQLHESCAELAGQRGGIAQAARKLEAQEQHAPADEQTQKVLQDKHPAAGSRANVTDTVPESVRAAAREALLRLQTKSDSRTTGSDTGIEVTEEDIRAALNKASAGKAAGPDGMRYEHAWAAMMRDIGNAASSFESSDEDAADSTPASFTAYLAEVYSYLLNEPALLPEESWRLLRAANLAGIGDKRRPIACASVWRRLMASIAARKVGHKLGPLLQQLSQLGCGVASGVEHVATTTRIWQQSFGSVIQLDCANAFNSVDRLAIIKGLERFCPELLPYFEAIYCGATMPEMRAELRKCDGAQRDAVYITLSELGCQQGDPLGPLLFAVAIAHALNPEDAENADSMHDSSSSTAHTEPVGDHMAYLDDLNLFVNCIIDAQTAARVCTTQRRLASIGLEVNMSKSLAVAQQGHTFTDAERLILRDLSIPFVDASTAESDQGFITVGVPVGTQSYVAQQLRKKLLQKSLWRFAWQLAGMAETNLQAAMIIFRGSFIRKFGYTARNVNPRDSAVWLSGFDGLCAWVLERMLHIHGATSANSIQQDIHDACLAGDCDAASNPASLVMPTAGSAALQALPLKVARLKPGAGGLGLPNLGNTCAAAYVAQLQVTMKPSLEHVIADTEEAPHGFSQYDAVTAYRSALRDLLQSTDLAQREMKRGVEGELLRWAADDSIADDDQAALDALLAESLRIDDRQLEIDERRDQGDENDDLSTAQQKQNNAVRGQQSRNSDQTNNDDNSTRRYKGLQRRLTALYYHQSMKDMFSYLETAGDSGLQFMAQLRSQRAPFAMAWLGPAGLQAGMSTLETVTMLLNSLSIEPWNLQNSDEQSSDAHAETKCCFCHNEQPTANHIMGCAAQHIRGHNAVHTGLKRCTQNTLKGIGFNNGEVYNELSTPYTVPVGTQKALSGDTVLTRGSLSLGGSDTIAKQGIILDSSATAATTKGNLAGVRSNAALTDGYASKRREAEKHKKHNGRYVSSRWKYVPFVQEAHGRLGTEAAEILGYIASEAAQRSGGTKAEITDKRSRILVSFKSKLSTTLATEMAQRIFGHVRGSAVHGQYAHPISALLNLSNM
jgi:hypothetical protein